MLGIVEHDCNSLQINISLLFVVVVVITITIIIKGEAMGFGEVVGFVYCVQLSGIGCT
jgi:hypothetical protein